MQPMVSSELGTQLTTQVTQAMGSVFTSFVNLSGAYLVIGAGMFILFGVLALVHFRRH